MAAIAEDDEKQQDFFRKRLDFVFYDYLKKSRSSRRRYRLTKLSALLLGSSTTALIGIKEIYPTNSAELGVAALICSALATVISQWENMFDYRYWWGVYLKASDNLSLLKEDVAYTRTGDNFRQENLDAFYYRYRAILEDVSHATDSYHTGENLERTPHKQ